ncbi:MAG: N-acetyl-gamma-glutamyl-phosphate reductase [Terriglobia bacterium]
MLRIGIVGASGYTGVELIRLLSAHKEVELGLLTSRRYDGKTVRSVYPSLGEAGLLSFTKYDAAAMLEAADLIYICLPHGMSQRVTPQLIEASGASGTKIIDFAGDFRLADSSLYAEWYGFTHEAPELLGTALYGLPETRGESLPAATFVANPGCYPTSAILALAPALAESLVSATNLVVDAKSGVSGAGSQPKAETGFCAVDGGLKAYGVGTHKHIPEIEQELAAVAGGPVVVGFAAHLVPMSRGLLTTCYGELTKDVDSATARELYSEFYRDAPFVTVVAEGVQPETKHVTGSNFCHVSVTVDARSGRLIATSAIDNLGKGASGQAVQNMNIMYGFDETEGISGAGLWP